MKGKPAAFYILYSPSLDKYYSGLTTTNIEDRLRKHNTSSYGSHFTSSAIDWVLRLNIHTQDYSTARKMEIYVKRMKSRKFIEKIINSQTERELFITKFRALDSPDASGQ
jgi:putative endonuclease